MGIQILFDRVNHLHLLVRIKENVVYKYSKDRPVKDIADWEKWFEENKWETTDLSASAGPDNIGGCIYIINADRSSTLSDLSELSYSNKKPVPHRHFSHLFNAYTRYLHTRTGRTGNLFVRPFKRKLVDNDDYLKRCILYIHNNPVHHGFCTHPLEYPWTSYLTCVSDKPTKLKREAVINLFGNRQQLSLLHGENFKSNEMDEWLEIDD